MPELPEPEQLREMVDEAESDYERRAAELEWRFSQQMDGLAGGDHLPEPLPGEARAYEVEPWPDGRPCVVFVQWTGRRD